MDQKQIAHEMIAQRAGRNLLTGLNDMAQHLPSHAGLTIRVTATLISTGQHLGTVDVDSLNADDLGLMATRRAKVLRDKPAPTGKPALRVVGGEQ